MTDVRKPWEMDWGAGGDEEEDPSVTPAAGQIKPWEMDWGTAKPSRKVEGTAEKALQQARSFGTGLIDPIIGAVQFGTNVDPLSPLKEKLYGGTSIGGIPLSPSGMNEYVRQREDEYKAGAPGGLDVARILGNVLSPASLLPMSRALQPAGIASRTLANTGIGAGMAAAAPVAAPHEDYMSEKGGQMGVGAALGAGTTLGLAGPARMLAPRVPAGIQELREMGVVPTLGQRLGPTANRIEHGLTSAPILGSAIREARNRTIEQFNRGIGNRALRQIGEELPRDVPAGHETVDYVRRTLSDRYDNLLPNLQGTLDPQFTRELGQLQQMVTAGGLPQPQVERFNQLLQTQVFDKFTPAGLANGQTLKEIERQLGYFSQGYRKSQDFDSQQLGNALREVQASLRDMIERNNPNHRGELRRLNRGWADFLRLENAASKVGAQEGVFTPAQLKASARLYDPTRKKAAFARGEAPMQRIAETGQRLLGGHVPDSGTPFRTALGLGMLGGGYAAHPGVVVGELATMLPYTRPGQFVTDALLSRGMGWRQPVGDAIRRASPPLTAGGIGPLSAPVEQYAEEEEE